MFGLSWALNTYGSSFLSPSHSSSSPYPPAPSPRQLKPRGHIAGAPPPSPPRRGACLRLLSRNNSAEFFPLINSCQILQNSRWRFLHFFVVVTRNINPPWTGLETKKKKTPPWTGLESTTLAIVVTRPDHRYGGPY